MHLRDNNDGGVRPTRRAHCWLVDGARLKLQIYAKALRPKYGRTRTKKVSAEKNRYIKIIAEDESTKIKIPQNGKIH